MSINSTMAYYDIYSYGEDDDYGFPTLSSLPIGKTKMSISVASQSIQDSIAYSGTSYIGLTHDTLDDSCVLDYKGEKLKVQYVNNHGRLNQVFLERMHL